MRHLAHLPSSKQRTDSAVVNYLRTHYAEFSTLTSDQTTTEQAERVAVLFADAGIYVVRLEPLVAQVRLSFVSLAICPKSRVRTWCSHR